MRLEKRWNQIRFFFDSGKVYEFCGFRVMVSLPDRPLGLVYVKVVVFLWVVSDKKDRRTAGKAETYVGR